MASQPRLAKESNAGRRPYQEDSVLVDTLSDGRILVAVADGMGGHAAGDVASALALEVLVESLEGGSPLDDAFRSANERVHTEARDPGKQGMGATLVAALIDGDEFHVANVGDSRCYLVSADGIKQLSEDHSFVAEAIKRGQSEEEALSSRFKDALTRSIGIDESVDVDLFGPFPVEQDTAVLLCSDGLYKVMPDERLRSLYGQSGGPRGAAQSLVSTAYEDGSDDNITVAIAEFGEVPRDRATGTMPIEFEPPPDDADSDASDSDASDSDASEEPDDAGVPSAPAPSEPAAEPMATSAPVRATSSGPQMGIVVAAALVVIAVIAYLIFGR